MLQRVHRQRECKGSKWHFVNGKLSMNRCFYCYKELGEGHKDFHPNCARKFFGTADAPLLEYKREDLDAPAYVETARRS